MRIVYCGYDFFHSCMAGLIEAGHEIVELFTWETDNQYDFNTRVIALAESVGARITITPMTEADTQRFREEQIDAVIALPILIRFPT